VLDRCSRRLLEWISRVDLASQRGDPRPDFATPDGTPIYPEGENEDGWWLTHQQRMTEPQKNAPEDGVLEDGPRLSDDDAPPADDEIVSDDEEDPMSDEEEEENVGDGFGCGESQSQNAAPPKNHDPDIAWTRPPTLEQPPPCYFETQRDEQCGLHTLNNAVGHAWQTLEDMTHAVYDYMCVMQWEQCPEKLSDHVSRGGWYSLEAMTHAINTTSMKKAGRVEYKLGLEPLHKNPDRIFSPSVMGAIVNKQNIHWVAIRFIEGKLYLLDSQRGRPILMSEREYRHFVKTHVGSFCIERAEDMSASSASSSSGPASSLDNTASPLLPLAALSFDDPPASTMDTTEESANTAAAVEPGDDAPADAPMEIDEDAEFVEDSAMDGLGGGEDSGGEDLPEGEFPPDAAAPALAVAEQISAEDENRGREYE